MSLHDVSNSSSAEPSPLNEELRKKIAEVGARPFHQQVIQSAWNPVIDVKDLHKEVKQCIRQVVHECGQPNSTRCLTVHAPAGYGKTHLLAWTRQFLEIEGAIFVPIPPFDPTAGSFERHLLRATLDALRLRSRRQAELFNKSIREFLAGSYDRQIDNGQDLEDLRFGGFWARNLWPSTYKLRDRLIEDQFVRL